MWHLLSRRMYDRGQKVYWRFMWVSDRIFRLSNGKILPLGDGLSHWTNRIHSETHTKYTRQPRCPRVYTRDTCVYSVEKCFFSVLSRMHNRNVSSVKYRIRFRHGKAIRCVHRTCLSLNPFYPLFMRIPPVTYARWLFECMACTLSAQLLHDVMISKRPDNIIYKKSPYSW